MRENRATAMLPARKKHMADSDMGQDPAHTKESEGEKASLVWSADVHVDVPAANLFGAVVRDRIAFQIESCDVEAGGQLDGHGFLDGDGLVVESDCAEGAGEKIGVEGVQAVLVYIQCVVTIKLYKVLDTRAEAFSRR